MTQTTIRTGAEHRDAMVVVGNAERSCEIFQELRESVSLVVTSPPYASAIDYVAHVRAIGEDYRAAPTTSYFDEYLPMLNQVWEQCWQLLVPGGILAINVASVLEAGIQIPLPQDVISQLEHVTPRKWKLLRSIVWHKVTAGTSRAGVVIQNPYPGYWHANLMTEYVLLFRKGGKRGPTPMRKGLPAEWSDAVWDIAPMPPRLVAHPAPFPEEIPHRLIRMYTNPGDWVFDPFVGSGTTIKAAMDLGRQGCGIDRESTYVDLALERLQSASLVRPNQLGVHAVPESEFTPAPKSIQRRHGTGLGSRRLATT